MEGLKHDVQSANVSESKTRVHTSLRNATQQKQHVLSLSPRTSAKITPTTLQTPSCSIELSECDEKMLLQSTTGEINEELPAFSDARMKTDTFYNCFSRDVSQ